MDAAGGGAVEVVEGLSTKRSMGVEAEAREVEEVVILWILLLQSTINPALPHPRLGSPTVDSCTKCWKASMAVDMEDTNAAKRTSTNLMPTTTQIKEARESLPFLTHWNSSMFKETRTQLLRASPCVYVVVRGLIVYVSGLFLCYVVAISPIELCTRKP